MITTHTIEEGKADYKLTVVIETQQSPLAAALITCNALKSTIRPIVGLHGLFDAILTNTWWEMKESSAHGFTILFCASTIKRPTIPFIDDLTTIGQGVLRTALERANEIHDCMKAWDLIKRFPLFYNERRE